MERLSDLMISLETEDVIDLPKVLSSNIIVELPKKLQKQYKQFKKTLVLEEHDVEAVNKGVLTNKLIQFANGGIYRSDEDAYPPKREFIPLHTQKMEALDSIVSETGGENLLIAYNYKFDLARLRKRFPNAVVASEDDAGLDAWNRGEVAQLLAHPASVAHGLNLQFGGRHTVWFGMTASLKLYQQFNARLRRPGQRSGKVFLHHILCEGTFDERLLALLRSKNMTQLKIVDAVKLHITRDEV